MKGASPTPGAALPKGLDKHLLLTNELCVALPFEVFLR